jgi:hypothetical protein
MIEHCISVRWGERSRYTAPLCWARHMAPSKFFHKSLGHRSVPLPGVIMPVQPGVEVEGAGEVVVLGSLTALGLAGDLGPEVVLD